MNEHSVRVYDFGRFRLDTAARVLSRDGEPVPLLPKAFDTLALLVAHSGQVLTKERMLQALWPDTTVEESNLSQNIYILRKVLRLEDGSDLIKTVPKRGYQFVGDVREATDGPLEVRTRPPAHQLRTRMAASAKSIPFLIAVIVVGGLAIFALQGSRTDRQRDPVPIRSLAVLPFKPLTPEARDESLELGIADTLITALAGTRELAIRPIGAVRKYNGLEVDPVQAGRNMQVDAVLEGTVQRGGGELRVSARLIRTYDARQIWSGTYRGAFTSIFEFQDTIAQRVAASLSVSPPFSQRYNAPQGTRDMQAYEAYLQGRYLLNQRSPYSMAKSIEYFRKAIARDSGYAQAYAALALSYGLMGNFTGIPPRESLPEAREAASKALQLDNTLAEGHVASALVREVFDWDLGAAEMAYRRAINLNPHLVDAHHRYGILLVYLGRFDEALKELEHARQQDPASVIINADIGFALYCARRYEASVTQLQKTLDLDPGFARAHFYLADTYAQMGRFDEALGAAAKLVETTRQDGAKVVLSYAYAASGRKDKADAILTSIANDTRLRFIQPAALAATYAALGDKDRAFEALERGYRDRASAMLRLAVDPKLDSLKSDPRFTKFVHLMRLSHSRL